MVSNSIPNEPSKAAEIALWGPTGAGKDWLLRAFIKELEYFNQQTEDNHFEIGRLDPDDNYPTPLLGEPPLNILPTKHAMDLHYIFQRAPANPEKKGSAPCQTHEIIIHNDAGSRLVDCLIDQYSFESTWQILFQSRNIILILGIPKENYSLAADLASTETPQLDSFGPVMDERSEQGESGFKQLNSEVAMSQDWSRDAYLKFMKLLLSRLGYTPHRNLAVCMTKSDQQMYSGDPWQVLQMRYGSAMRRLLEVYKSQHAIEVFITSATGYIKQSGTVLPNFQGGALRDPNRWNPVNSAAPFFWIFDQIERTQTGSQGFRNKMFNKKTNSNYPCPRRF